MKERYNPTTEVNDNCTSKEIQKAALVRHQFLQLCTLLDPRFREQYFEKELNLVEKRLLDVINQMGLPEQVETNKDQVEAQSGFAAIFRKKRKVYGESLNEQLTETKMTEIEIKNYLKTPIVDMSVDPLLWWRDHEKDFPRISKAAKKYLAVQGTSVASERVFSKGGKVITEERTRLTGQHAAELIFLAMNKCFVPKPN